MRVEISKTKTKSIIQKIFRHYYTLYIHIRNVFRQKLQLIIFYHFLDNYKINCNITVGSMIYQIKV